MGEKTASASSKAKKSRKKQRAVVQTGSHQLGERKETKEGAKPELKETKSGDREMAKKNWDPLQPT